MTKVGDGFDYLPLSADRRPKYTTVKFRVGWYSYEMDYSEYYQQAIDAIKLQKRDTLYRLKDTYVKREGSLFLVFFVER